MAKQRSRRVFLRGLAPSVAGITLLSGCSGTKNGNASSDSSGNANGTSTGATDTSASTQTTGQNTSKESKDERTVTDALGRSVTVPSSVDRVVALGPGALRLVAYVGATDRVVGVEQLETSDGDRPGRPYHIANPNLSKVASVGSRKSPDAERVLKQNPQVILWAYASKGAANDFQQKVGAPVVVLDPGDLTGGLRSNFYDSLTLVGKVLGETKRAKSLVSYTKQTIQDLKKRVSDTGSNAPKAYIGYLGRGKHGLLYTEPSYPPFAFVGANNVASGATIGGGGGGSGSGSGSGSGGGSGSGDGSGSGSGDGSGSGGGGGNGSGGGNGGGKHHKGAPRLTIDPEQLIKWNPEYIFVDGGTESYDALSKDQYASITAIKQDRIYRFLPIRDYSVNFATALADAYYAGSVLFPDQFGDVKPKQKADDLYEQFVGKAVYDDVAQAYGGGFQRMKLRQ